MIHPEYQYLNLLKDILDHGVRKIDRGTGDASLSVFGRQIRFDLASSFPLLTTKKVFWKGVLHELYWFLSGQSNIDYLVRNNVHIWDDYPYKIYLEKSGIRKNLLKKDEFIKKITENPAFAKKWGNLPKIYGEMWRRWPTSAKATVGKPTKVTAGEPTKAMAGKPTRTIDQVQWVIDEIKDDPNAHNLIVNSWNPEYLYGMALKKDASRFPICHNMYQVNIIEGKLSLQLYQRSADIFLGVPFNIASYALLALLLAKITGYQSGEFIHTFGDVHIYESHIQQVREQLKRKPLTFPTLSFTHDFKTVDEFKPEYVQLNDYQFHPPIKAPLSVSGGFFQKKK